MEQETVASSVPTATELMHEHELATAKDTVSGESDAKPSGEPAETTSVKSRKSNDTLDISCDEAFPSLGSTAKPVGNAAWPPTTMAAADAKGTTNGTPRAPATTPGVLMGAMARHRDNSECTALVELQEHERRPKGELKKPAPNLAADIAKRTGTRIQLSTTRTGVLVILIKGPFASVERAKRDLRREICLRQNVSLPIPTFVRPHIIGKQGVVIQKIQHDTGTKITIPKMADGETPIFEDDGTMITVSIEGDVDSVRIAKGYIDRIVAERTAHTSVRLEHIPGQFFPFIAGPNFKTINQLQEGKDLKIHVPEYYYSKTKEFSPAPEPIIIRGEKAAVNEAKGKIEALYQELMQTFIHVATPIPKYRHRFIYGDRGQTMHQILEETGCSVVFPTPDTDANVCVVTGPNDKIGLGIKKVKAIAMAPKCATLDITKAHRDTPIGPTAHAVALSRLFKQNRALEAITGAEIVPPTTETLVGLGPNSPVLYDIIAKTDEELKLSKMLFQRIVTKYTPQKIQHVTIDPIWHEKIRGPNGRDLKKLFSGEDVRVLLGEEAAYGSNAFIVYEGKTDATQEPSAEEISQRLQEVWENLTNVVSELGDILEVTLTINKVFHSKIKGERNTTLNALSSGNVSIQFASPTEDSVFIRGVPADVETTKKKIMEFADELQRSDVADKPYALMFDYPSEWSSMLIGTRGANINKLRDELGVDIKLKEGKGEIKGVKANAEAAERRLFEQIKNLENNRTVTIKIPQEFHKSIIGAQGKLIRRLEERHSVRIHLGSKHARYEEPSADASNEAGRSRQDRALGPDDITIKGSKKDIEKAQKEIEELIAYEKEHSQTDKVEIAVKSIRGLLTTHARDLKRIREDYSARIDIPQEDASMAADTKLQITIRGTKQDVAAAKKELEKIIIELDASVMRKINVEKQYHRELIGPSGATLRTIIEQAGGSKEEKLNKMIRFPPQDSDESEITIEGLQCVVDKIIEIIAKIVDDKKNQITEVIDVAPEKHRMLIGRGGQVRRDMEAKFNVSVDIPRQNTNGPTASAVRITGRPENVAKAKAHILEVADGEVVMVPRKLHHIVADSGLFIKKLRNDIQVFVDHDGQPFPQRPASKAPTRHLNGSDLPLITDADYDESKAYSWEVVENDGDGEEGDFPWVLRGSLEAVAQAKGLIAEAIEEAKKQSSTGYLILPDPSKYRFVVGPSGSTVNQIRADTGCRITIPREKTDGEAIVLQGTNEGVEMAKGIILDVIKNKANGENYGPRRNRGPKTS